VSFNANAAVGIVAQPSHVSRLGLICVGLLVVSVPGTLPYVIQMCSVLKEAILIFLFFIVFHSYTQCSQCGVRGGFAWLVSISDTDVYPCNHSMK
jgi:hypothetical protein